MQMLRGKLAFAYSQGERGSMAEKTNPVIYIIDDDKSVLRAMQRLIKSTGMDVETFVSVQEFLAFKYRDRDACMIVDIKLHGKSGLELPEKLRDIGSPLPVIFITGFDTPETREQAKRCGAVGYFRKPIDDQALLDSIQWALTRQTQ
jgi:FixJ family two-component response regulator